MPPKFWKDSLSPCSSLANINSLCFSLSLCAAGKFCWSPLTCWFPSLVLALGSCSSQSGWRAVLPVPLSPAVPASSSQDTRLTRLCPDTQECSHPRGFAISSEILEILGCKAEIHTAYSKPGFTVGLQTTLKVPKWLPPFHLSWTSFDFSSSFPQEELI